MDYEEEHTIFADWEVCSNCDEDFISEDGVWVVHGKCEFEVCSEKCAKEIKED